MAWNVKNDRPMGTAPSAMPLVRPPAVWSANASMALNTASTPTEARTATVAMTLPTAVRGAGQGRLANQVMSVEPASSVRRIGFQVA